MDLYDSLIRLHGVLKADLYIRAGMTHPIQGRRKGGDALSSLLFNFASDPPLETSKTAEGDRNEWATSAVDL